MASVKLSGEGRFRWTQEHRLALHLLRTEFQLDSNNEVKVFSHVFGADDISKGKLSSQYGERIREGKDHQWRFLQERSPAHRRNCQVMKERLAQAVNELDVEELSDDHFGRLSLSTHTRPKRSRSSPQLRRASHDHITENDESPAKRRRGMADLTTEDEEDDGIQRVSNNSTECNGTRDVPNTTDIPVRPRTPRTPRKGATVVYNRPSGPIMLTPEEFERTKQPLTWPDIEPPRPALLFRYWIPCTVPHEPSCIETSGAFVARRFRLTYGIIEPGPPPTKEHPASFWTDIGVHLNGSRIDTPFVSVSNSLAWTLRQAIQKTQNGAKKVNISLIATNPSMTLYYPPPYHKELKNKFPFTNGAWNYQGTNEFLVYYSCKPFLTLSVSEIMAWCASNPAGGDCLRLSDLSEKGNYQKDILPKLKEKMIDFTPRLARSIANIATSLFKFDHNTPSAMYKDFVAGICEGWGLCPRASKTPEQWNEIAADFAHVIIRKSPAAVDVGAQGMLKFSFLTGVKLGLADRMAAHRPDRFVQIEKRSQNLSLSSPAKILTADYDAIRVRLSAHEKEQDKVLLAGRSQLLPAARAVDRDNDNEEQIMYEEDVEDDTG